MRIWGHSSSGCSISPCSLEISPAIPPLPWSFLGKRHTGTLLGRDSPLCLCSTDTLIQTSPCWNSSLSCSCLSRVSCLLQCQQLLPSVTGNPGWSHWCYPQGTGVSCRGRGLFSSGRVWYKIPFCAFWWGGKNLCSECLT